MSLAQGFTHQKTEPGYLCSFIFKTNSFAQKITKPSHSNSLIYVTNYTNDYAV